MEATRTMSPATNVVDVPLDMLLELSEDDSVLHRALARITEETAEATRTTVAAFQSSVG